MYVLYRFITFLMFNSTVQDDHVEYEDEFGRIRTVLRSEVPRNLRPDPESDVDEDE